MKKMEGTVKKSGILENCDVVINNSEELSKLRELCTRLGIVSKFDRAPIETWSLWKEWFPYPIRVFFNNGLFSRYCIKVFSSERDRNINELLCAENNFNNNFLGEIK